MAWRTSSGFFCQWRLHELLWESGRRAVAGVVENLSMGQFCTMDITEQCVVALTWTLKDTLGEVLDVLDDPVEFLVGGDDLLPRIEEGPAGPRPWCDAGSAHRARRSLRRLQRPTAVSGAARTCSRRRSKKA
jgi:hypothetical protein